MDRGLLPVACLVLDSAWLKAAQHCQMGARRCTQGLTVKAGLHLHAECGQAEPHLLQQADAWLWLCGWGPCGQPLWLLLPQQGQQCGLIDAPILRLGCLGKGGRLLGCLLLAKEGLQAARHCLQTSHTSCCVIAC